MTYNREAAKAPAHYDHRGLWCLRCQTQQSHYRAHKSTAPWRCTVCEHVDGEPAPDPADALYNRATGWNAMKSEDVDNPRTAERLAEVAASVAKEFPERLVGGNGRTPQPMPAMDPIQKALAAAQPTDPYVPRMDRRWQEKYGVIQSVPATPAGIAQAAQGAICEREAACTCGSGGHPRRCALHPERFDVHCAELTIENQRDEISELESDLYNQRKYTLKVEAERDALRAECEAKASAIDRLTAAAADADEFMQRDSRTRLELHLRAEAAERRLAELSTYARDLAAEPTANSRAEVIKRTIIDWLDCQARETSAPADIGTCDAHRIPLTSYTDVHCERCTAEESGETSATASAESARETPPGDAVTRDVTSQRSAVQESPEPAEEQGPRKGEPAAEALTAEKVVGIVRMQGLNWDLTRDEAIEVVERYACERRQSESSELSKRHALEHGATQQQLAAAKAECDRLRDQLAQRTDTRLREAADHIREVLEYWAERAGRDERPSSSALTAMANRLHRALAAEPAPQVEREALPTVAELQESAAKRQHHINELESVIRRRNEEIARLNRALESLHQAFSKGLKQLGERMLFRLDEAEKWLLEKRHEEAARDNALTASGALAKEAGKTGGDHG